MAWSKPRSSHRETRSFRWLDHLSKDIHYGARSLPRTPGFTAVAVLTLALGIGANTAIFSVVGAVLLRPLAYQDPGRLVTVLHYGNGPVAPGSFLDWRAQSTSLRCHGGSATLAWERDQQRSTGQIEALRVTPGMLAMLGVQPVLGRWFVNTPNMKLRGARGD